MVSAALYLDIESMLIFRNWCRFVNFQFDSYWEGEIFKVVRNRALRI